MSKSPQVLQIQEAIIDGQITDKQCQLIAQGLQCVEQRLIQPGKSNCASARAAAGESPVTADVAKISNYFPNPNNADLPHWCINCRVFAPALVQLSALLEQ